MIKEFKNGNLKIDIRRDVKNKYYDISTMDYIDRLYNEELTMSDYYFNSIEGYDYLVNYRTKKIYDFSTGNYRGLNALQYLDCLLDDNNYNLKLYPLPKKEAQELFNSLDYGY